MNSTLLELLRGNREHAAAYADRFDDLQDRQAPPVVTVSCADSRVLADHVWGNDEPGRLFTCATIGNRVRQRTDAGSVVSGDVLYPLRHTGTRTAVVLGHTGCGAVTAAHDHLTDGLDEGPPGIAHCVELLAEDLSAGVGALPDGLDRGAAVNHLVEYNVDRQVDALLESEDVPDDVQVAGAVYDFGDVYPGPRGLAHVVNVDGERDPEILRDRHPEVADRLERRWVC